MEKLMLDVDAVAVESFDAGAAPRVERGTVLGNDRGPSRLDGCHTSRGCTEISPC